MVDYKVEGTHAPPEIDHAMTPPRLSRGDYPRVSRRDILRTAAAATLAAGLPGLRISSALADAPKEPELIVRSLRPLDLETPVEVFDRYLTPNRLFFIRSHFGAPAVDLVAPWSLKIEGLVKTPLEIPVAEIGQGAKLTAVLQCAGNGRALYQPIIPGVGWEKGAVGNATWEGVRLADLLKKAGVGEGSAHIHIVGADGPPSPKTPAYLRSIPIAQAMDPNTILATRMNGEPLPAQHGGPLRLIVAGWTGNHWIKWIRAIVVSKEEAPGFYQRTGYKMPIDPSKGKPGVDLKPDELKPVTELNVKSLIASPSVSAEVPKGKVAIKGVAWTGPGRTVAKVEVGVGEAWRVATLIDDPVENAWRRFEIEWDLPTAGPVEIRAKATDSAGQAQPEVSPWNKSGYLWNGIDRVAIKVI